jgi:hypothetical protein
VEQRRAARREEAAYAVALGASSSRAASHVTRWRMTLRALTGAAADRSGAGALRPGGAAAQTCDETEEAMADDIRLDVQRAERSPVCRYK